MGETKRRRCRILVRIYTGFMSSWLRLIPFPSPPPLFLFFLAEVARTTDMLIPKLVNVCRTEQEREVVLAALETLALLINELKSAAFQDSQHINTVVSLVKDAFNNKVRFLSIAPFNFKTAATRCLFCRLLKNSFLW